MPSYPCRHRPIPFEKQVEFAQRLPLSLCFRHDPPWQALARCRRTDPGLGRRVVDQCTPGIDFLFRTVFSCDAALFFIRTVFITLFCRNAVIVFGMAFHRIFLAVLTVHCLAECQCKINKFSALHVIYAQTVREPPITTPHPIHIHPTSTPHPSHIHPTWIMFPNTSFSVIYN